LTQAQRGRLTFFATPPHPCSYLPEREATTVFADPRARIDTRVYSKLARHGFRRSGSHVYRPQCVSCAACVPVRVLVDEFVPRRNDLRTLRDNADLALVDRPAGFEAAHFDLYRRYIAARHPGGGMDNPEPSSYLAFLTTPWVRTRFLELRAAERLLAVAVVDELEDALSAVYTFFEPDAGPRSLGRYAVLREIELARARGMRWLYLGYWIEACAKMSYKAHFQPLEYFIDGNWRRAPD
jgi:arginine-tRNA-protein transferase